jgi:hypothetical protein
MIITASKDGVVILWKLSPDNLLGESQDDEEVLNFVSEISIGEPITKAKWLNAEEVLVATTYGNLYSCKTGKDGQGNTFLDH